jgi:hypothetical protein
VLAASALCLFLLWCLRMVARAGCEWGIATTSKVGAPGFEPGTFWSQTRRATGLRYAPLATASTNLATLPCSSNLSYPARRSNTSMSARMARPRCDTRCFAASGASPNPIFRSSDQKSGS